jgi:hypothetical protein
MSGHTTAAGSGVLAWTWRSPHKRKPALRRCSGANSGRNIPDMRSGTLPLIAQRTFRRVTRFTDRATWRGAIRSQKSHIYLVQNLPEFVHLTDDQLPAVIREQLEDFAGLIVHAREEITDPNQIVYRPITSGLLPGPWFRRDTALSGWRWDRDRGFYRSHRDITVCAVRGGRTRELYDASFRSLPFGGRKLLHARGMGQGSQHAERRSSRGARPLSQGPRPAILNAAQDANLYLWWFSTFGGETHLWRQHRRTRAVIKEPWPLGWPITPRIRRVRGAPAR